jgi:hypothetical protein
MICGEIAELRQTNSTNISFSAQNLLEFFDADMNSLPPHQKEFPDVDVSESDSIRIVTYSV